MKRLRKILFTLKNGLVNVWTHKSQGLASIFTIFAVSVIMGIVILTSLNLNLLVEDVQSRVEGIEIYIEDSMTDEEVKKVKKDLEDLDYVGSVDFKDKDEALEIMKEAWGDDAYLLDGLEEDNPLDRSFLVKVTDIKYSDQLVEYARGLDKVSSIVYYQDTINKLIKISNIVRTAGLVVFGILLVISILVISNTVRLTVQTRSKEIEIMKYLGATDSIISTPFVIEGVILGLLGAILAYLALYYGYDYLYMRYSDRIYQLASFGLVSPSILKINLLIIFASLGAMIGASGSVFSAKKYLRV